MALKKEITADALVALGADALAEALVERASVDPILRKELGLILAAAKEALSLAEEARLRGM